VLLFRRGIVGELARLRWPSRHRAVSTAQPTTEVAAEVAP
jgi:preprotein translocase subunit SecE